MYASVWKYFCLYLTSDIGYSLKNAVICLHGGTGTRAIKIPPQIVFGQPAGWVGGLVETFENTQFWPDTNILYQKYFDPQNILFH